MDTTCTGTYTYVSHTDLGTSTHIQTMYREAWINTCTTLYTQLLEVWDVAVYTPCVQYKSNLLLTTQRL